MVNKNVLTLGLEKSFASLDCRRIEACRNHSFVHDMKPPNDLDAKVNARIMAIGSSPGKMENSSGRPFISKKIDSSLEINGMSRNDVYFSDVVKCRLTRWNPKTKKIVDRKPTRKEIDACFPLLENEIRLLKPDAIVAMGKTAINLLTGEDTVSSAIESGILEYRGIPVIPAYHPRASAIQRDAVTMLKMRNIRTEAFAMANEVVSGRRMMGT